MTLTLDCFHSRVYNSDNGSLTDLHYHLGSQISLLCEVTAGPIHDSSVQWIFQVRRESPSTHVCSIISYLHPVKAARQPTRSLVLNEDTERGGVMINTWHLPQEADTLVSNLTLYRAGPRDKVGLRYSL